MGPDEGEMMELKGKFEVFEVSRKSINVPESDLDEQDVSEGYQYGQKEVYKVVLSSTSPYWDSVVVYLDAEQIAGLNIAHKLSIVVSQD